MISLCLFELDELFTPNVDCPFAKCKKDFHYGGMSQEFGWIDEKTDRQEETKGSESDFFHQEISIPV